ncbi:molybdenum cofactor biosynthesis protein C [Hyphomonas sp. CACIAM 19H1]|uniref:cyclic pyranopterin monophosphate synthase MoaC n=1 Tax=Hyphomonas sp. CACIAM 19H1 TaxID=1873716 RepID=UPI000DED6262|nr:cyclic pyranopterin monophosphate synthase MoaC [Hyphomonas sp. CACIAM 19H1]AXE64967.1 molybdenum cofactor biosynthesis protein C [Hyphomonas sp. CACIAM 19H1]
MTDLTHIGPDGRARMVDISGKTDSERRALATGRIRMSPETLARALSRDTKKGDPLAIAELAGIMGAKRTADLIPLCHPLPLTGLQVEITEAAEGSALQVSATARTTGKTGVEMEALTAVTVACLTLYDMLKAIDKSMVIEGIELVEKSGGASGDYRKAKP